MKQRSRLIKGLYRDDIENCEFEAVQFPDSMPEAVFGGYQELNDDDMKN